MLFSIVIPVYNVENYIEECLESIIVQVPNLGGQCEIILVDDGSTDSSGEICERYTKKYPEFVKTYHKSNEGLLLTRRFGYKCALGEYVINCDSDDILESDTLATLYNVIEMYNKPDIVFFNFNYYVNGEKKIAFKDIFSKKEHCVVSEEEIYREYLLDYKIVSVCEKVYKKKCIDLEKDYVSYSYICNGEDSFQTLELFDNAESFIYLNKALYNYRMGTGMTSKFDENYYNSFIEIINQVEKRMHKWKIENIEELIAVKVFAISGRAITQSRYKKWKSYSEHKEYLRAIRESKVFNKYIPRLNDNAIYIQKWHSFLLNLLKNNKYLAVIIMLKIKNLSEKIRIKL